MPITRVLGPDGQPLENFFVRDVSPDEDQLLIRLFGDSRVEAVYDVATGGFTLLPTEVAGASVSRFGYEALSPGGLLAVDGNFVAADGLDEIAVVEPDGDLVRVLDPPANARYFSPRFLGDDLIAVRVFPVGSAAPPPFDVEVIDLATGGVTGVDVGPPGFDRDLNVNLFDSSADGGTLLLGDGSNLAIYDAASGEIRELPIDPTDVIDSLQLTPDGAGVLAITADEPRSLNLFDAETGAVEFSAELPTDTVGGTFAVDPSGRFLAAGSQGFGGSGPTETAALSVYDLSDGSETTFGLNQLFPQARGVVNPSVVAVQDRDGAPAVTLQLTVNGEDGLFELGLDALAVPDEAETPAATPVTVDALANDVDFGGDGLELVAAAGASNGTARVEGGAVVYTPNVGFFGEDSFAYTIRDGAGNEDEAEVLVLVTTPDPEGFVVTTAADVVVEDGELSLREAVQRANDNPGLDTITFADELAGATIELRGREVDEEGLVVTDDLVIDGDSGDGGPAGVTIVDPIQRLSGGEYDFGIRVLSVTGAELALEDLTVRGGNTGVYARDATLTTERVLIDDVGAVFRARGVEADASTVRLVDSTITGIDGFYEPLELPLGARGGSDVTLLRSSIVGNYSYYGGTVAVEGRLRVEDSTIAGNFVERGYDVIDVRGGLEVVNSTIANNGTGTYNNTYGKPIVNLVSGSGSIVNSTIAGNRVNVASGGEDAARGNAVFAADGAELTLENSLVLGNFETVVSIGFDGPPSTLSLDVGGNVSSLGGNVFGQDAVAGSDASDVLGAGADEVFADVREFTRNDETLFEPVLADNGGPTETAALLNDPANPAIGLADPGSAPTTDQRGFDRDDDPDAGAFEAGAEGGVSPPPPPVDPEGLVVTTGADVVADDGELSLREAVERANVNPGLDTITFADGLDEVVLESGALEVTDALVVDGGPDDVDPFGDGPTLSHADGQNTPTTLFEVRDTNFTLANTLATEAGSAIEAYGSDVTLDNVVFQGVGVDGGAVVSITGGSLIGDGVSIDNALLGFRGAGADGIRVVDATVSLIDSVFSSSAINGVDAENSDLTFSDTVFGAVGGVAVKARSGSLTFDGGEIAAGGPAIDATGGAEVSLSGLLVQDALLGGGEATAAVRVEGSLAIEASSFALLLLPEGGSVVEVDGTLGVTNSTFQFNSFTGPGGAYSDRSAVLLREGGEGTITNSTIAGNFGPTAEVPAVVAEAGAELRLENNLILANGDPDGPSFDVGGEGAFVSNGGNVFGQDEVAFAQASDVLGAEPERVFAEVGANGLPEGEFVRDIRQFVLPLLDDPANPAIGQAVPEDAPPVDQRGLPRDAEPDAGAFELQEPVPPPPPGDALTVTFVSEEADYANTLGYFLKGEDGRPTGEAGILFEEVSDEALSPGDTATLEGVTADEVGFFLIRNGANLGLDFDAGIEVRGERLLVGDVLLKDYQVQFDTEEGQLLIQEIFPPIYNWEDKALSEGSYDGDFDDAVFTLERFAAADDMAV